MDEGKKTQLVQSLSSQPEPQVVPVAQFFDGNDDPGSIGCNLLDHPGVERFREILTGLENREDVQAVFAQISEVDPGEDCWPFADTVLVVGTISPEELSQALSPLKPDEIGTGQEFAAHSEFLSNQQAPVLAAWWD